MLTKYKQLYIYHLQIVTHTFDLGSMSNNFSFF